MGWSNMEEQTVTKKGMETSSKILLAIIVVLAVIAGAMFLQTGNAKEPTKVKITSDKEQFEVGNYQYS